MDDFNELIDDNANWQEYDTCPKCDGNGGWYIDADGFWSISRLDDGSIEEWIECDVCQGMGAV